MKNCEKKKHYSKNSTKIPRISKIKMECVFVGFWIFKFHYEGEFECELCDKKNMEWKGFKLEVTNYLGSNIADKYKHFVENVTNADTCIGVNVSFKIQFWTRVWRFYINFRRDIPMLFHPYKNVLLRVCIAHLLIYHLSMH